MVFHFLTWHFLETEKYTRKSTHERGQVLVHFSDSLVRVTTDQNTHLRSTQARGTPVLPPVFHASSHWPRNPQGQGTKPIHSPCPSPRSQNFLPQMAQTNSRAYAGRLFWASHWETLWCSGLRVAWGTGGRHVWPKLGPVRWCQPLS